MRPSTEIRRAFDRVFKLAEKEQIRLARQILKTHPHLDEYVCGMGTDFFTQKERGDDFLHSSERAYMRKLRKFMYDYDEFLHLTGNPLRFTATSKVTRNW